MGEGKNFLGSGGRHRSGCCKKSLEVGREERYVPKNQMLLVVLEPVVGRSEPTGGDFHAERGTMRIAAGQEIRIGREKTKETRLPMR